MGNGTRAQCEALIATAGEQMGALREQYEASIRAEVVTAALQIRIKNVLENQRSALEYVAHHVVETYGKAGARAYFPVTRKASDFDALFERQMKGVAAARPDIKAVIERHQPYQPEHEWLLRLATLTNENKHQGLSPQKRVEATRITPGPGGGSFGRRGGPSIQLGGGASIVMSGGASISFGGGGAPFQQNITTTVLVDWLFTDLGVSALGTLESIQSSLPSVVDDVLVSAGL